jgi:hypothetical protein
MSIRNEFNAVVRMLEGLQLEIEAESDYDDLAIQLEAILDRVFVAMESLPFDEDEDEGEDEDVLDD